MGHPFKFSIILTRRSGLNNMRKIYPYICYFSVKAMEDEEEPPPKTSMIFSDYFKEQSQQSRRKQTKGDVPPLVVESIISSGLWSPSQKTLIIETIKRSQEQHPSNLQQQVNFLHFHLQQNLGKRIQVFAFDSKSQEGHCLFTINNLFIEVQYGDYVYVVWKVKLIEDRPHEQEY